MIKIKTKLLIIVMAVVLFVNSYDLRVFANTDYDHDRLLEYDGYAEAIYESIVEQTTFISGRYTENKEYVNDSINEITDYARGWWDEYMRISEMPPKEKIREMVNAGGGYLLTVGDFIKNLFTDKAESEKSDEEEFLDYESVYGKCFNKSDMGISFKLGIGCSGDVTRPDGEVIEFSLYQSSFSVHVPFNSRYVNVSFGNSKDFRIPQQYETYPIANQAAVNLRSTFNGVYTAANRAGFIINVQFDNKPIQPPNFNSRPINNIRNYINENPISMVIPQPKAYLSCPDGTRVNMSINGGTFLDSKGNIMSVDKNGIATVDSQICNLGWEKPKIEYIGDKIGITDPDDRIIDVETGEIITGDGDKFDDEIEDGCGTLCAIGKLLKGLGTLASAIASIPLKILDGLFEVIKKIVVPPDNYLTEEMDSIKEQFFNEEIEEGIQSIEELSNAGGGTFESVQVSIMGVDNVMVVDSSSVNKSLDTIHSWIRGIFYPLLLFFNINMLYRLIRGTSLVGIGHFGNKGGGKE